MHHSFCIDRLLWGSTVGHPSDSWASCVITDADIVAGIELLSAVYVYVCMCVCQHCTTETTGHIITKLGMWIVNDKCRSPSLFEVKRTNVKVYVSLHSFECQSSSLLIHYSD